MKEEKDRRVILLGMKKEEGSNSGGLWLAGLGEDTGGQSLDEQNWGFRS